MRYLVAIILNLRRVGLNRLLTKRRRAWAATIFILALMFKLIPTTLATSFNTTMVSLSDVAPAVKVDASLHRIYATNISGITVIDSDTFQVVTTIPVNIGGELRAFAVDSVNHRIYAVNYLTLTLSVIDGNTNTVTNVIPIGTDAFTNSPHSVAVDPILSRIYVGLQTSVVVVDAVTLDSLVTVPIPINVGAIGLDEMTHKVYITNPSEVFGQPIMNTVTVLDGTTNTITATIPLAIDSVPTDISVDSANQRIYVANKNNDTLSVINGASNTVISSITVGDYPVAVGVNTSTRLIYVANNASNTVSVIDGTNNTLVTTIPVVLVIGSQTIGLSPSAIAVNENADLIYVSINDRALFVIGDFPTAPPDTETPTFTPTETSTSTPAANTLTVDTTSDADLRDCTDAPDDCSLRGAINLANADPDNDVISFDSVIFGTLRYIVLTAELPALSTNIVIDGPSATLLDVQHTSSTDFRIFSVSSGATVKINGLTILNGIANEGGGIRNDGTLILTNVMVSGNSANAGNGGGIANYGTLTILDSTIGNNFASAFGGGIANVGTMTITNTTFSGNNVTGSGGAIYVNNGTLTMTNSTLNDNYAPTAGSIIFEEGDDAVVTLRNTIAANGTCVGPIIDDGGNLAYPTFCGNIPPGSDPLLGFLQDNGGTTLTYLPGAGSPAIDNGIDSFCAADPVNNLDQRGIVRPIDGDGDLVTHCDIGAVELDMVLPTSTPTATATATETPSPTATASSTNVTACEYHLGTVNIGRGQLGIGVNSSTNRIYVSDVGADLKVVNGADNNVLTTIPMGASAWLVGVDSNTNRIYVLGSNLLVINGADNSVLTTIPNIFGFGMALNKRTNRIYVASTSTIFVINSETNSLLPALSYPNVVAQDVAVNEMTNRIYLLDGFHNTVSVINGADNSLLATIPVGNEPIGVAVDSTTNRIFVADQTSNTVSVINGVDNTVIATIPLPVNFSPRQVAVNNQRVYVTGTGGVVLIDGNNNNVIRLLPSIAVEPLDVAVNTSTNRIYVTDFSGPYVDVISGGPSCAPMETLTPSPTVTVTPTSTTTFSPTPSVTPMSNFTDTATLTSTTTDTLTNTSTVTETVTYLPTATDTATVTSTLTPSATETATFTDTATDMVSATPTTTVTDTATPTATVTGTPTRTSTATETVTSTPSLTVTLTDTATSTFTNIATNTPTATLTFTASPSDTSTTTATNTPTDTLAATATDIATVTQTSTVAALITATPPPTNTPSATPTATLLALVTATPLPSTTPTAIVTATATHTGTETLTATATAITSMTSTATSTTTYTSTPTATLTLTVSSTPTRTAAPSNTVTPSNTAGPNLTFYRAINIGGPAITIDGNSWAANTNTTQNFTTNGARLCDQWRSLIPPTDANRSQMIRCYREHWAFNMAMTNVPSGTYVVYLYVWQSWDDPATAPYDILVEGQTVVNNYNPGNVGGRWERLGPWTINVTDGTLNLTTNGSGLADISGLEVYQLSSGAQPSATSTATVAMTRTITPTATVTNTPIASASAASTGTLTATSTMTPSRTVTATRTPSRTPTSTVTPGAVPSFYRAYNLGGSAITIDGRNWLAGTSPELNIENATSFCNQTVPLVPITDANRTQMLRCSVTGTSINVEATDVANGFYDIYIYIWEDNTPSTFSIAIQGGQVYVPNINSGAAGTWQRYGPYTINVSGGWFSIDSNGGQANLSGIELYRR